MLLFWHCSGVSVPSRDSHRSRPHPSHPLHPRRPQLRPFISGRMSPLPPASIVMLIGLRRKQLEQLTWPQHAELLARHGPRKLVGRVPSGFR